VPRRGIGIRTLALFEAGSRILRHVGLGSLVDRIGPSLGGRAARCSPAQLLDLLERLGYTVWRTDEARRVLLAAAAADLVGDYANLVCARGAAVHVYEAVAA
jgi:hypothetical protein